MTKSRTPEPEVSRDVSPTTGGLDRRRFVGMVGASLAAEWLIDPASLGWSATAAPPSGEVLVPGYLRASHLAVADESVLCDLSDPALPPYDTLRRVIPEELPLEFISSTEIGKVPVEFENGCARFHIHGVLPPHEFSLAAGVEALHLEAEVSLEQEKIPYRHYVWGFDGGPVENISGPTRFEVPVGEGAALGLQTTFEPVEEVARFGDSGKGRGGAPILGFSTLFTLEDHDGQPRLRPGVYCLPLNEKALDAYPLVANRDWLVPDDLPYLLFSVESLS